MSDPRTEAARTLGKLGKGVPKRLSYEERQRRSDGMKKLNQARSQASAKGVEAKARLKDSIKAAAEAGVFVPIQESE